MFKPLRFDCMHNMCFYREMKKIIKEVIVFVYFIFFLCVFVLLSKIFSADNILKCFFLFSKKIGFDISGKLGVNWHEMSNSSFWEK